MLVVLDTHVGAVIIISGILSRSSICFILLLILEIFIYFNLVYQGNRVESEVKLAYERKQWTKRILETYPSRPAHSRTFTQNSLPDTNDKGPSLMGTMYHWASNLSPSSGPFHLLEELSSLTHSLLLCLSWCPIQFLVWGETDRAILVVFHWTLISADTISPET